MSQKTKYAAKPIATAFQSFASLLEGLAFDQPVDPAERFLTKRQIAELKKQIAAAKVEYAALLAEIKNPSGCLDAAHDKLSGLLEDEDAENDDIRAAAVEVCESLNAHHHARQRLTQAPAGDVSETEPRTETPSASDLIRVVLVYQGGIANVFRVDCFNMQPFGRNARRVLQGAFRECEAFARGMMEAGAMVHSAACNMAGDIAHQQWTDDLDSQPFCESFRPVMPFREPARRKS